MIVSQLENAYCIRIMRRSSIQELIAKEALAARQRLALANHSWAAPSGAAAWPRLSIVLVQLVRIVVPNRPSPRRGRCTH